MTTHRKAKKSTTSSTAWRRWSAGLALTCSIGCAVGVVGLPAWAQDPAQGEATLNFVGADIESVIKAVGHFTNRTFIIDPRVKGTINLVSEKPVSKAQAFNLLTSALRLQGYAVVTTDGYTKVVPEADAKLQAGPIQAATATVHGDQIATQIFHLNYESAQNLVTVLRPLISPNNTINANIGNNSLVVTDYADNLKRIAKIVAALDSPASGDVDVVPIKYAISTDIATMVNRLLEQGAAAPGGDAGRMTLLADTRTNSVLLRAPSAARANLAKSLIAKLDQPTAQAGNVHVVYLRNAEAIKLAQTLRAVVSGETSSTTQTSAFAPSQAPTQGMNQVSNQQGGQGGGLQMAQPSQQQQQTTLPSGGPAGFIQADVATNSLIITASEPVYRNLRAVIDQLDARRAQVYIESLIVEVSSDKASEFGVQWAGLTGDNTSRYRVGTLTGFSNGGNNLITLATSKVAANASSSTGIPTPGNGLNLGVFRQVDGALTLGAIAHALASEGNTNILSMPNVITLDNDEAQVLVGQNVPFVTGQFTTAASAAGAAGVNPFQTIERKDIGLTLKVRPQVSEGGSVKLAIYQETSTIAPTSGASDIVTNKRAIQTNVLVDDGQIVVLGGLIDDNVSDTNERVPGLGDIPVLGNLFKYQKQNRTKRNLMVFLRPTVIRTNEQNVNLAADRYEYIRNAEVKAQPEPTMVMPNLGAPVLPELKDGRMVDGPLYNLRPANGTAPASSQLPQQAPQQVPPAQQPAAQQSGK